MLTDASSDPPCTLLTWPIYSWSVAFLAHREYYERASQEQGVLRAKFKIELDHQYAYYGLYIERGAPMQDVIGMASTAQGAESQVAWMGCTPSR